MNEGVSAALAALRRGEGIEPLEAAFAELHASDPQQCTQAFRELGALSGFPPQILDLLESRFPDSGLPADVPAPDPVEDGTVLLPGLRRLAQSEDPDPKTVFVPPTAPQHAQPLPSITPPAPAAATPDPAPTERPGEIDGEAAAAPLGSAAQAAGDTGTAESTAPPADIPAVTDAPIPAPAPADQAPTPAQSEATPPAPPPDQLATVVMSLDGQRREVPAQPASQLETEIIAAPPTDSGAPRPPVSGPMTGTGTGTGGSQFTPTDASSSGQSSGTSTTHQEYPRMEGEPLEGDTLRNRFLLEKKLGSGGMGVVFKAWDKSREAVNFSNREQNYVAIKLLNDSFRRNPDSIKVLGREFSNTKKLSHPNIISLNDFDRDDNGRYFISMELLTGKPLNEVIAGLRNTNGLPFPEAFHLIEQMGSALAAAHNYKPPIIHSDFKPGNVYVSDNKLVKVFDFGIARAARPTQGEGSHETTNYDAGSLGALTPAYASLEMLLGAEPDPRDDIYALAIVAYELLTGKRPFGRKTTALLAREQGLTPARVKSLTARQWRGLRRGLAFERSKRSQRVEQFLDDLRPRRSLLVPGIVVGVVGVGSLGWFLGIDPWLKQHEQDKSVSAVAAAPLDTLGTLVKQAGALPEPARKLVTDAIIDRLAKLAVGEDAQERDAALAVLPTLPDDATQAAVFDQVGDALTEAIKVASPVQVLQYMALVERLPTPVRAALLANVGDPIRNALIAESRSAFSPEAQHYDYARAQDLLNQADRLFADSKVIFDEKSQLIGRYKNLLSSFDERLTTLREQKALLPAPGQDSIPAILAILTQLDAAQFPSAYAYLANSYYSEAKAAEASDPTRAAALVKAGLDLFPESTELKNQQARLEDLARSRTAAATLDQLRRRVEAALATLGSGTPAGQLLEDLRTLRSQSPNDPLLATVARQAQSAIRAGLPDLLKARDWDGAQALLERYADLAPGAFMAAQTKAVEDARAAFQSRINKLNAAVQERLTAGDLNGAEAALKDLAAAAPNSEDLTRRQSELARAYLMAARAARAASQWDRARTLVDQGLARVSDPQRKLSFEEERTAIDRDETAGRQQVAQAERERQETERQASIAAVRQQFNDFVISMGISEADALKARGFLDRLAGLAPDDPLLETGLNAIAARVVTLAGQQGETGHWEEAIAMVRSAQRQLPGARVLDQELARLTARYQEVATQRNLAAIATQEETVGRLLAAADFSPDWAGRLGKALSELSRLAGGDPARLAPIEERVNAAYEERLAQLNRDTLFAEARTLLDQWAVLAPNAARAQKQARAEVDAAFAAWEKAEGERKRLAEIDANKQSLLTQAKADQPEKALSTLELLRKRLGANDPFITGEAPREIAQAEIRLAAQSAKRGRNDNALKWLDKAVEIDPQVEVAALRTQIERNLAHDRMSDQIRAADGRRLGDLATPLGTLKQQYPQDYPAWEDDWAKALATRIKAEKDVDARERMLRAAVALFPMAQALKDIPALPVAAAPASPPPLDDVRAALANRQLSAAERGLTLARARDPGNPGLTQLASDLAAAQGEANTAYNFYKTLMSQGQSAKANKALDIARQGWKDKEWPPVEVSALQTAEKPVCNPRYAGYGNTRTARCMDTLAGDKKGPELVVIPQGSGSPKPYAITRYEISVAEYNDYCASTKECNPVAAKNSKLPVTGVSIAQAQAYAAWLTRTSGATYHLPSGPEWEQAARAKGEAPTGAVNCLLRSGGATIKGGAPDLVTSGANNSWGLVNAVGNVQEWTIDGGAIQAHGGHYGDDAARCAISLVNAHSGQPDAYTGFRLIRDIRG